MDMQILSQRDPRWSSHTLGNSTLTIGDQGCLLTDYAMLAGTDPVTMDTCRKAHGCYSGALSNTADLSQCAPAVKFVGQSPTIYYDDVPADQIQNLVINISEGNFAIAMVDPTPGNPGLQNGEQHWVLIVGTDPTFNFTIYDPWFGDQAMLCPRYGATPAKALYKWNIYSVGGPTTHGNFVVKADQWANVRAKADPNATILGGIPDTSTVTVDASEGNYAKVALSAGGVQLVSTDGLKSPLSGYIHGSLLPGFPVTNNPPPPPPPPPPVIHHTPGVGAHTLANGREAQRLRALGCEVFTLMSDEITAGSLATGDPLKWYPGCGYSLVMFRQWHQQGTLSRGVDIVNAMGGMLQQPNAKNVILTLWNEWDGGIQDASNTGAGLRQFLGETVNAINALNARGFSNIAIGTFSVGTPNFTNPDVCQAMKDVIAPLWNAGKIKFLDYHGYAPNQGSIFKRFGQSLMAPIPLGSQMVISGFIGRNRDTMATWMEPSRGILAQNAAAVSFDDTPDWNSWFERRWEFLYTRCGFDPEAPGRIVMSEMGLDEGGVGGFPAHKMNQGDVDKWIQAYIKLQAAPLVVAGKSYPSPFLAGAIFQSGNIDPHGWLGYDVSQMEPLTYS